MGKLTFQIERCKGCGLCIQACPKGVLEQDMNRINSKGHHPITAAKPELCIGCAFCATMCPDCVIRVER